MTKVEILLPDAIARRAAKSGFLTSEAMNEMLREKLRAEGLRSYDRIRAELDDNPLQSVSMEEIDAEIKEYRAEKRRAARP